MHEDVEMSARARCGVVQQARAGGRRAVRSGGIQVGDAQRDVVQTRAALLDKFRDRRIGIRAAPAVRCAKSPAGSMATCTFSCATVSRGSTGMPRLIDIERQRFVEGSDRDAQMIDAHRSVSRGRQALRCTRTRDCIQQFRDARAFGRDRRKIGPARPRRATAWLRSPPRALGARAVGLVDDEDVGDLHDAGLDGLNIVAHAGHQHHHGDLRVRAISISSWPDADGFDDDEIVAGGANRRAERSGGACQAAGAPRVAMERMKMPGSA